MIGAKLCLVRQNTISKRGCLGDESAYKILRVGEENVRKEQTFQHQAYGNIQIQPHGNVQNGVQRKKIIQCQQVPEKNNDLIGHVMDQDKGDDYEDVTYEYSGANFQSISKQVDETVQIRCNFEKREKDVGVRCTSPESEDSIVIKDSLRFTEGNLENTPQELKILLHNNNNDEISIDSSKVYYIQSGNLMKIEDNSSCSSIDVQIVDSKHYDRETAVDRVFPSLQISLQDFVKENEGRTFDSSTDKFDKSFDLDELNENALKYSARIDELLHIEASSDEEESYERDEFVSDANSSNFVHVDKETDVQPESSPLLIDLSQLPTASDNESEVDLISVSDAEPEIGVEPEIDSESTESCYSRGSSVSRATSPINVIDHENQQLRQQTQKSTVRRGRRPLAHKKKCDHPCCNPEQLPSKKQDPRTSSPKELLMCREGCKKGFMTRRALVKHQAYCAKGADHSCKYCNFKTKHRSAIKPHVQQHVLNNDVPLSRAYQSDTFAENHFTVTSTSSESKLAYENRLRRSIETKCKKCGRLSDALDSKTLCQLCYGSLLFKCKSCPQRANDFYAMRLHVIRCHFEKVYRCVRCRQSYSYALDLKRHLVRCLQNGKPFSCGHCGFLTTTRRNLSGHMERRHPEPNGLQACQTCGIRFGKNYAYGLKRHEERCSGRLTFYCEHCSFLTASKFSLKRHIYNKHLKLIVGEDLPQQLTCDKCGRRFKHFYDRDTHEDNCTGV